MSQLPFYVVPLTHQDWDEALAYAKKLPAEAIPEVRLDLLPPDPNPETIVFSLKHHCVVSCRRVSEGGQWPDEDEAGRMEKLKAALQGRPQWLDLEWELDTPKWLDAELSHTRLLRSIHAAPGIFDLEKRLQQLPEGDAYKWVGHAGKLADNLLVKSPLAWAKDHRVNLSAFLQGNKGVVSRCMQAAWGGGFTYAAPDNAEAPAPGQIKLKTMMSWRCHRLHQDYGLCGVLGKPVFQSKGPAYHNLRFQQSFKDLIYLPLEVDSPEEAMDAIKKLPLLGASVTMPLKETLPTLLGLPAPINTIWHRADGEPLQSSNTDFEALKIFIENLPSGPVLVLGSGGVATASIKVLEMMGRPLMAHSRRIPVLAHDVATFAPVGVIQATSLGMDIEDPLPFPDILEAAIPTLRWAIEWVNRDDTEFISWAKSANLRHVQGLELFEKQAGLQSRIFISECGGQI
jgi:3-dehydroquinate dehydratase/shikimate dehydrogenase